MPRCSPHTRGCPSIRRGERRHRVTDAWWVMTLNMLSFGQRLEPDSVGRPPRWQPPPPRFLMEWEEDDRLLLCFLEISLYCFTKSWVWNITNKKNRKKKIRITEQLLNYLVLARILINSSSELQETPFFMLTWCQVKNNGFLCYSFSYSSFF